MEWKVRFVDYPAQFRKMEEEIMSTVRTLLSQGDLMMRAQMRDFEANLASFVGTRYGVGTSNCTDALHLSLRAAGIGPGDEVITVSHTFVATVAAVHHSGATPILVDIRDDHNMDPEQAEAAITPRTRALLPVHLNGRLCDMERLTRIAERHGLLIIEDSAQALGASLNGRKGGAWGAGGCFSFYPAKLLGAFGDAGAMVTDSPEMADRVKLLRDHGRSKDGEIACWSFNCRLDNLQAALLDLKLKRIPEWLEARRALARRYHEALSGMEQLLLPPPPEDSGPYYDVFQNYEIEAERRDELVAHLKGNGVEILVPWGGRAVHQSPALGLSHFHLPRTEEAFRKMLLLPMHTELREEQVDYVAETIRRFYRAA
jgi:dTDP-4-amino-4,6-dideoxygalactose transaminase